MEQVRDRAAAPFEQWLGERRPEPKAEPLEGAEDAFTADIGEGLQFEKAEGHTIAKAWLCGTLEDNRAKLAVTKGSAQCELQPRQLTTVRLMYRGSAP